jgi:hypothetical protein
MSIELRDRIHRYHKLNMTSNYTNENTTGKLSFTVPTLNRAYHSVTGKNDCLIKIRRVYLSKAGSQSQTPIGFISFDDPGGFANFHSEGLSLNTSLTSHTNVFCKGGEDGFSSSDSPKSMLGCTLHPSGYSYLPPGEEGVKGMYLQDVGTVRHEDSSKIEDSGTVCSNPFGTTVDIWLSGLEDYTPLLPYSDDEGEVDGTVYLSVELEVMTLPFETGFEN